MRIKIFFSKDKANSKIKKWKNWQTIKGRQTQLKPIKV